MINQQIPEPKEEARTGMLWVALIFLGLAKKGGAVCRALASPVGLAIYSILNALICLVLTLAVILSMLGEILVRDANAPFRFPLRERILILFHLGIDISLTTGIIILTAIAFGANTALLSTACYALSCAISSRFILQLIFIQNALSKLIALKTFKDADFFNKGWLLLKATFFPLAEGACFAFAGFSLTTAVSWSSPLVLGVSGICLCASNAIYCFDRLTNYLQKFFLFISREWGKTPDYTVVEYDPSRFDTSVHAQSFLERKAANHLNTIISMLPSRSDQITQIDEEKEKALCDKIHKFNHSFRPPKKNDSGGALFPNTNLTTALRNLIERNADVERYKDKLNVLKEEIKNVLNSYSTLYCSNYFISKMREAENRISSLIQTLSGQNQSFFSRTWCGLFGGTTPRNENEISLPDLHKGTVAIRTQTRSSESH